MMLGGERRCALHFEVSGENLRNGLRCRKRKWTLMVLLLVLVLVLLLTGMLMMVGLLIELVLLVLLVLLVWLLMLILMLRVIREGTAADRRKWLR